MALLEETIGFLGGGNMAFAIGYGLINRGNIKSIQFQSQFHIDFCIIIRYY